MIVNWEAGHQHGEQKWNPRGVNELLGARPQLPVNWEVILFFLINKEKTESSRAGQLINDRILVFFLITLCFSLLRRKQRIFPYDGGFLPY